jgi:hypothetical protein
MKEEDHFHSNLTPIALTHTAAQGSRAATLGKHSSFSTHVFLSCSPLHFLSFCSLNNVVHTGPKANTNKNINKQISVVPQNRVRPRRQQIVYYWKNDTNIQLNPVQSQKTQCFTLTLTHSLKSALFHSHTLPLSVHTCTHTALSRLCLYLQEA